MRVRIFGKQNCAKCETTKNKFNHFFKKYGNEVLTNLEFYDMDTVDGYAEGAYHDVLKIPTTLIEKESKLLKRWDGEVPNTEEFKSLFE